MLVTLVTPARNAAAHLPACLSSVLAQTHGALEWCVFDDGSSDETLALLESARPLLAARGCSLQVAASPPGSDARGCGYGRNRAIELSSPHSALLVFLDADDVMHPKRVELLLAASLAHPGALLGSRYWRDGDARPRDLAWHNGLSESQLVTQRLRETTLAMPTWAMSRHTFQAGGCFAEDAPHNAEDLQFFYAHLRIGGALYRLDQALLMYRHTEGGACATRGVPASLIWAIRVRELERVLAEPPWREGFTVWNAGKEGHKLYRALSPEARRKVRSFADVDERKIRVGWLHFEEGGDGGAPASLPVVHFSSAKPPLLLCVKALGLAGVAGQPGSFEANLESLGLTEGRDYLHFS